MQCKTCQDALMLLICCMSLLTHGPRSQQPVSVFSKIQNLNDVCAYRSSIVRMAKDNAKLLVLGADDFAGFKELDSLPPGIELVGLGTADEMLGLTLCSASSTICCQRIN